MTGTETQNQRVTQKDLAAALGVTSAAITKARGIGRVVRGDDGLYDLVESLESFRESRSSPAPAAEPAPSPPSSSSPDIRRQPTARPPPSLNKVWEPSSLLDFKTLHTREMWLKARLERQQKQGELVERGSVDGEWQSIGVRVRDAMLQIPYAMAQQLAAEDSPRAVRDLLRLAIEQALTRLCDEMDAGEADEDIEDDEDGDDQVELDEHGIA